MEKAKLDLLVIEMQMGDKQAFNKLCQYFHSALLRFAFKICQHEQLAHDAVQNAWIKIIKSIHSLNDPRAFKSWLYQQVRWQCLDALKQVNRELLDFDTPVLDEISTKQEKSDNSRLLSAINSLAEIEKQVIHLFYLDELSLAEIAIVLEIPIGTVKSRLNRARNLLKERLIAMEKSDEN